MGINLIQKMISNNNFEKIRKYLYFNNNNNMIPRNNPGYDHFFYKITPLINA